MTMFPWWVVSLGCFLFGLFGFGLCAILTAGKAEEERQAGHAAGFRAGYDKGMDEGWREANWHADATATLGDASPVTLDFTDKRNPLKRPPKRTATKKRGKGK